MFIHGHILHSYCINLALTRKFSGFDNRLFLYPESTSHQSGEVKNVL